MTRRAIALEEDGQQVAVLTLTPTLTLTLILALTIALEEDGQQVAVRLGAARGASEVLGDAADLGLGLGLGLGLDDAADEGGLGLGLGLGSGLGLGMGDAAHRLAEARVPRGVRELRELEAERAW